MSAEAMNSEEVRHHEVFSSKNHDADKIQEDMVQDIYENAIQVCNIFFCQIIPVFPYFSCFIIM